MDRKAPAPPPRALRRDLGLWTTTLAGVGVIIGAGIYVLIGVVAGVAGNAVWLSFLVAGIVAALTGASYARFAAIRPLDSPEFQYTRMAFGPRVGFLMGWLTIWADLVAAAVVALGFGAYLEHITGVEATYGALGLVMVMSVFALWGITQSMRLAVLFTLVEVGGLLLVAVSGVGWWGSVDYLEMPKGLGGVWTGAALAFFAYLGFDELGNLAEETRDPRKTLPKALGLAVAISTALYLLVGISAVSVVGWAALHASEAPLALVMSEALGSRAADLLSVIALVATANTVLLLLIAASRSLYGMASAGVLPARLATIGKGGTPWLASSLVLAMVASFVLFGELEGVAKLADATVLVPFLAVNLGLFWMLRSQRHGWLRMITNALMPLAGALLCSLLFLRTGWVSMAAVAALAIIGGVLSRWIRPKEPTEAS